ncbi:MAG TPA: hypothetical protein P5510_08790 [Clostridia bacterium]|nr:hypothetical protein [Clostridia bacterium]
MKRVISLLLCFALIVSAFAIANVTLVSAASVPAGFPAEIPFADDAFSITGERNDAARSFSLSYKTDKKLADVAALYRNFIKLYDSSYQETKGDIYSIFICKFPNYDLNLTVMEILSNTNVNITLYYHGELPAIPAGTNSTKPAAVSSIETNQSRLKLPVCMPKDIPFTKDAVLYKVDDKSYAYVNEQTINITYDSKMPKADVVSLYKEFSRSTAEESNELNLGGTYLFTGKYSEYDLSISIEDNNTGTRVSLVVTPKNGVFNYHFTVTDYSDGIIDNRGVINFKEPVHKMLMAGPAHTDPYNTNIFVRKNDKSLWGYGAFKGIDDKNWSLIDKDAFCLDTEGNNYFLLKPDGSLWIYGGNEKYLLGNGQRYLYGDYPPTKVLDGVRSADIGKNGTAVKKDNSLWIWGQKSALFSVLDDPEKERLAPVKAMDNVVDAAQSGSTGWTLGGIIMVLKTDGSVWTWGEGNCGDGGVTPYRRTPIKVLNGVKSIKASNSLCCAIKNDNSLWIWESHITSSSGKMNYTKPTKVMENVKMVSPGERFLVVLKNDGTVWTLGDNYYGQCGIGSLNPAYIPAPRKILDGAAEVIATEHNAFALMQNGNVLGWGINDRTRREGDYDWLNTKDWRVLKPAYIFNINAK